MKQIFTALIPLILSVAAWRAECQEEVADFGTRYDAFYLLFADEGFQLAPFSDLDLENAAENDYSGWIIISLGDPSSLLSYPLNRFVVSGGGLLLATEQSAKVLNLVEVRPTLVEVNDPEDAFEGRRFCPILRDFTSTSGLFDGIESLVANRPAHLRHLPNSEWSDLAAFPASSTSGQQSLIAARIYGDGRLLVSADPSMFTNEMIREGDNAQFAFNVASWLAQGRDPSTMRVVILDNGRPLENWIDDRFVTGQWENVSLLELLNELLVGLERENAFNQILADAQSTLPAKGVRQAVLILLFAVILAALVWRMMASRRPAERTPGNSPIAQVWSSSTPVFEGAFVAADRLLEHRQREIARLGNYAAPLRELARSFLTRRFGQRDWQQAQARVKTQMGFWSAWKIRRKIRVLFDLAGGRGPEFVSRDQFQAWRKSLAEFEGMLRENVITVEVTSTSRPTQV